jgi:DNA-binding response OmpR family regulator
VAPDDNNVISCVRPAVSNRCIANAAAAPMKALLIEDEPKIAEFVRAGLEARGVELDHCADGNSGLDAGRKSVHDVILLDIMLPGRDGLELLQILRREGVTTPVILLTARNELGDRIAGLDLGADDYLAKPFYVEELLARMHALQRRLSGDRQATLPVGRFTLDRIEHRLSCRDRHVELTSREYGLLEVLMRSAGRVVTRSQLLEHVWGYDFDPSTNVVDVCVKRIRAKIAEIEPDAAAASPIESVRGVGYRFEPSDDPSQSR